MTTTGTLTFTVTATGVGRTDYSQDVQKTVEPVAYNWQETYSDYQAFSLNVGESATIEIPIALLHKILLYEYYLSCYPASNLLLQVDYFDATTGLWSNLIAKTANQHVDVRFERGFPFTTKYRIIATNLGVGAIDCYYSAHGILTLTSQLAVG